MNKKGANLPIIVLSVLLIIVIIVIVFMFYNFQSPNTKTTTTKTNSKEVKRVTQDFIIKECSTDMNCFIDAAKVCQKAKTRFTTEVNLFGIEQTTQSYYELKGTQSGKCLFYIKTENVELQFSEELVQQMQSGGASQEEINQQLQHSQNLATQLGGRDGTCNIEAQRLVTLLIGWQQGDFSTEDFEGVDCSGEYFESELCVENWSCSDWSSCINSQQTRECTDLSNCYTIGSRPNLQQTCESQVASEVQTYNQTDIINYCDGSKQNNFSLAVIVDDSSYFVSEEEIIKAISFASSKLSELTKKCFVFSIKEIIYMNISDEDWEQKARGGSIVYFFENTNLNFENVNLNGIVVLTNKGVTGEYGGFSDYFHPTSEIPNFCNKFESPSGQLGNRSIYLAFDDWEQKYAACGYNDEGVHISNVSLITPKGVQCSNRPGTNCLYSEERKYYVCENAVNNLYLNKTYWNGCNIVHEFMHSFGLNGNNDHFGTGECNNIMSGQTDISKTEYYCGMCPYVYENFANSLHEC